VDAVSLNPLINPDNVRHFTKKQGYGAMANQAWHLAKGNVTLWLEDDWVLSSRWDLTGYVRLLEQNERIGMIRLGHLPIDLQCFSVGYNGRMYLEIGKNSQYVFSGNPHLKHKRFMSYGMYPTGKNPGDTEIAYDHQYRTNHGQGCILWPLAIGDRFVFSHIGEEKSY